MNHEDVASGEGEGDVDEKRRAIDAARNKERTKKDSGRLERRELNDQKRQNERGASQARYSLNRERLADDADRHAERQAEGTARSAERALSDSSVALATLARADAEETTRASLEREGVRLEDVRNVRALVRLELGEISAEVADIAANVPRGSFEGRLSKNLEAIRASLKTVTRLVDGMDSSDSAGRQNEIGGSG